jgi:hypothetical protein
MGFINMCKAHFKQASPARSKEEQLQLQKVSFAQHNMCHHTDKHASTMCSMEPPTCAQKQYLVLSAGIVGLFTL